MKVAKRLKIVDVLLIFLLRYTFYFTVGHTNSVTFVIDSINLVLSAFCAAQLPVFMSLDALYNYIMLGLKHHNDSTSNDAVHRNYSTRGVHSKQPYGYRRGSSLAAFI